MGKSKKWAKRCQATTPVTMIAKDSIDDRLEAVLQFAPLAAKQASKDVEHVHQLRVCVRRASAALKLYAPVLSKKRKRKVKKQLRALRRAAGPARDLDVLAERISEAVPAPGLASLRDFVASERQKAQQPVRRIHREMKRKGFSTDFKKLVGSVKWRSDEAEPDFGSFARSTFPPIIDRFFAAGQADLSDIEAVHQMRIEGKMTRYAMELLSPAFGKSFRKETYPVFAEVQDKLGAINDHASAIRFYSGLLESADHKKSSAIIQTMVDREVNELESSRQQFLDWWTPERIAEMRRQFEVALLLTSDQDERDLRQDRDSTLESTPHSAAESCDGGTSGAGDCT